MDFWNREPLSQMSFGFEAELLVSFKEHDYPQDPEDNSIQASSKDTEYQEWRVTYDTSVKEPDPSVGVEQGGVEVISPVFRQSDMDAAKAEIRRVFRALEKHWGPLSSNHTCGLHVHVGSLGPPICSSLRPMKSLVLLMVAFEHLINSIVPDIRLRSGSLATPPSANRRIDMRNINLIEHLERIMNSKTIPEVIGLINPDNRYQQCNVKNFLPRKPGSREGKIKTVEFRAFPGTVDPEQVIQYAEFWMSVMTYAHEVWPAELDALLQRAFDPRFDIFQFLDVISCSHLRKPFAKLWKPITRAANMEPPWHPRWWPVKSREAEEIEAQESSLAIVPSGLAGTWREAGETATDSKEDM